MIRFQTLRRLLVCLTLATGLVWVTDANVKGAGAASRPSWAKVLWNCQTPGPRSVDPNQQKLDIVGFFRPDVNRASQRSVSTYVGINLGRCIGEIVVDSINGKPVMVITATASQIKNYQDFAAELSFGTGAFSKVQRGGSCSACAINPFRMSGS